MKIGQAAQRTGDIAAAIAIVALVTMFVRPGSNGPALVDGIGNAFIQSFRATVGANTTSSGTTAPTSKPKPLLAATITPTTTGVVNA